MGKRNPLEDEFYNSMLYKNLGEAGEKVAQGIGKAVEEVGKGIGRAVEEVGKNIGNNQGSNQGYNRGNHQGYPPVEPPRPSSYNPPPKSGSYRYTPPAQPQGVPYQKPRPVPPPQRPVAPPVPKMKKQKKRGGSIKFILAAAACIGFATVFPIKGIVGLALMGAVALGVFLLTHALVRGVQTGKKEAPAATQPKPEATPKEEPSAKPKAKPTTEPKVKPSDTGNPELDKIIDEGNAYLIKLRSADNAIADEGVSASIVRMETACRGIFDYVRDNPAKMSQIRKFLNYYLPTTLKLLGSYEKLSRQKVKGENITATMFDIEGMMQTIATAFEKQLDGLFSEEAMDIQADITVFESILQQEGLKDDEQTQTK